MHSDDVDALVNLPKKKRAARGKKKAPAAARKAAKDGRRFGTAKAVPSRHPGSARFHAILRELGELHDRKQEDYGGAEDPFANVRATERWHCPNCRAAIPAWLGALIRLSDKVARLQSFTRKGRLANEAVEDSLRDIPVYSAIALVLYEEKNKA